MNGEDDAPAARRGLAARVPWVPVLVSVAVLLGGAFATPPVRDAATRAAISEASLERPMGYVLVAPLSDVLDTLTLLSVRQHIALFAGLWLLFIGWRLWRRRGAGARRHLLAALGLLLAIVTVDLSAILLPRPMAYLTSHDPYVMRVDFHSHTAASGDARRGFDVEDNRAWHRRGGYDVAFIADHGTVAGAERGIAGNRASGLDEPMLLQSIEVTWTGEHVGIVGAERTYRGLLTPNHRDVEPDALDLASVVASREPVVIWHHPRVLGRLPAARGPGTAGIRAIEISNGAPDGMDQVRPKRDAIAALAQERNLALTTASDNHGWGYTAPNWTLMRGDWRALTSDQLTLRIERAIREQGSAATRPVERTVADGTTPLALAFTVVTVPARMLTTLSGDERVMWLVWTWLIPGALALARRRMRA